LRRIFAFQFFLDAGAVHFDGSGAETKLFGHFAGGEALAETLEDLFFAGGEALYAAVFFLTIVLYIGAKKFFVDVTADVEFPRKDVA
jgi:hypothetical protein